MCQSHCGRLTFKMAFYRPSSANGASGELELETGKSDVPRHSKQGSSVFNKDIEV